MTLGDLLALLGLFIIAVACGYALAGAYGRCHNPRLRLRLDSQVVCCLTSGRPSETIEE